MEQAKIRPSVTLYSLDLSLPNLVCLITSAIRNQRPVLILILQTMFTVLSLWQSLCGSWFIWRMCTSGCWPSESSWLGLWLWVCCMLLPSIPTTCIQYWS